MTHTGCVWFWFDFTISTYILVLCMVQIRVAPITALLSMYCHFLRQCCLCHILYIPCIAYTVQPMLPMKKSDAGPGNLQLRPDRYVYLITLPEPTRRGSFAWLLSSHRPPPRGLSHRRSWLNAVFYGPSWFDSNKEWMNTVESLVIPFDHFFAFRTAVNTQRHCAKTASLRITVVRSTYDASSKGMIDRSNALQQAVTDLTTANSFTNALGHIK